MSENVCPKYPAKGLISGDPIPTAQVSGRGELSATGTSVSQVAAPGLTNRRATGVANEQKGNPNLPVRTNLPSKVTKPKGGCLTDSGSVQAGSSKPSTSKAVQVPTGKTVKTPSSGVTKSTLVKSGCNVTSHVPIAQEESVEISPGSSGVPPKAPSADQERPRHKTPSKRAFSIRRSAYRTIDRFGNKPAEELTEKEKSSLEWARARIAELKTAQPPAATDSAQPTVKAAPKRQRSGEEQQQPRTKRPMKAPTRLFNRPFNEVAKDQLMWAVIDRNVGDGTISPNNWEIVKSKLMEVYWKILEQDPGPPPQCDDAGWFQGHIKLIACADQRSATLYKKAIASLGEVWQGARLDAVPLNEIPRRPRSTARVPALPCDPTEILRILQNSNPQLPTHDWKVVKVTESVRQSRRIVVVLNEQSLAPIRERRGKIYYGFGTINLRVYRGDDKGDTVPSDGKSGAPEETDCMSCEETASSSALEEAHSVTDLVGTFFEQMDTAVDEDALLESESDLEDADVTITVDNGGGEGNTN